MDSRVFTHPSHGANPVPVEALEGTGFVVQPTVHGDLVKRKRGRPRKYGPPSSAPLAAATTVSRYGTTAGSADSRRPASIESEKKKGRPRKDEHETLVSQCLNNAIFMTRASGFIGRGFTPHHFYFEIGEDVAEKISKFMFTIHPLKTVVLSACGMVKDVTLARPNGINDFHEGFYEIMVLGGAIEDEKPDRVKITLTAATMTQDRTIGGIVNGPLLASSEVQVVVGAFKISKGQPSVGYQRRKMLPATTDQGDGTSDQPGPTASADSGRDSNDNNEHFPSTFGEQAQTTFQVSTVPSSEFRSQFSSISEDHHTAYPIQGTDKFSELCRGFFDDHHMF